MVKRILPALRELITLRVDTPAVARIHDDNGLRCLRFSSGVVQSAMRLADPFALDLGYTRAMMGFLLFRPAPQHVLVIGLGGGSLPKYCHREFPGARITAIEIDPAVIALRDQFLIPADSERFRIIQADAGDWLLHHDTQTDVILLDGYDAAGLPDSLSSMRFYSRCHELLDDHGVLAINLWGGEPNRSIYVDRLRTIFDDRVWWCRPCDSSSLVVFAVKNAPAMPDWSRLRATARTLDARYRLGLTPLIEDLRLHPNPDL